MSKKKETISVDEELMMCSAYRYAIGRHSYIITLADYIAKTYYNKLSEDRLEFTAKDIKESIGDNLKFGSFSINYDGTVPYDERDAFGDMMQFCKENIKEEEDINKFERIEVYKESYSKEAPKKFRIHTCIPNIDRYNSQMDIDDLIPWYSLAQFFDKKNYVTVHVKYNGKEEDILAFKSWRVSTEPVEENSDYYKYVPWKWEECYIGVDNYYKNGHYAGYISPEFIVSVN